MSRNRTDVLFSRLKLHNWFSKCYFGLFHGGWCWFSAWSKQVDVTRQPSGYRVTHFCAPILKQTWKNYPWSEVMIDVPIFPPRRLMPDIEEARADQCAPFILSGWWVCTAAWFLSSDWQCVPCDYKPFCLSSGFAMHFIVSDVAFEWTITHLCLIRSVFN